MISLMLIFLLPLIPEQIGRNVPLLSDMWEINQIVDHVGLMELLKLSMIDIVLKMEEKIPLYSQLLILPLVVVSCLVILWDVMVDKLELLGHGLIELVLLLEEILVIKPLVSLIQWKNVLITFLEHPIKNAQMLKKLIPNVKKLVHLEMVLVIWKINKELYLVMDLDLSIKSNKI